MAWNNLEGVKRDPSQSVSIDWSALLPPFCVWRADGTKAKDAMAGSKFQRYMIVQIRRTAREVPERVNMACPMIKKWGYLSTFT